MEGSNELVAALDIATKKAISMNVPLRRRLEIIADEVRTLSTVFAEAVDAFVLRLQEAEAGRSAPDIGDPMPDFLLPSQDGTLVGLSQLCRQGPVVVAFLRGHWCPYCQATAATLAQMADEAVKMGASIVAISPEHRQFSNRLSADSGARFPILTDVDNGYALALNLAIWVDDAMAQLIFSAGWDIPSYQTSPSWFLPIPATFVVDRNRVIVARHVNADYRTRMDIDDILAALDTLN